MKRWAVPTRRRAMLASSLTTSLFLFGCQQNPFPATGPLSVTPPQPIVTHEKPKPIPAYVLTVPDVMVFQAKEEREYTIQATVPAPGKPIVSAKGLPRGAHFYPNQLKIVWMPPAIDPGQQQQPAVVEFSLQSTEDAILTYKHNAVLVVQGAVPTPQVVKLGDVVRIPFLAPAVRIQNARADVEWKNQELVVHAWSLGLQMFDAVAVLEDGQEQSQPFSFWVVP